MGPGAAKTRFQDAIDRLERAGAGSVVVVPLLASSHSGHYEQIRWLAGASDSLSALMHHHLEMSGIERATTRVPMCVVPALDESPELARVLSDRALALARSRATDPRQRALLIVGHGPNSAEDNAAWMTNLRIVADSVRRWTGFRDVRVDLVRDDAPHAVREEAVRHVRELIVLQRAMTKADVLVIPLLVSAGAVSREKVPADLAGTPHVYGAAPLLSHPAIVQWIERRVRDAHCTP
jgi:sirohydrochlorin ferrochelatase